jgi:hypothetical protein
MQQQLIESGDEFEFADDVRFCVGQAHRHGECGLRLLT